MPLGELTIWEIVLYIEVLQFTESPVEGWLSLFALCYCVLYIKGGKHGLRAGSQYDAMVTEGKLVQAGRSWSKMLE